MMLPHRTHCNCNTVFRAVALICAIAFTTLGQSSGGNVRVRSSTVAGGGGTSSGGNITAQGTAGQPGAGSALRKPPFSVSGGVWPTIVGVNPTGGPATISGLVTNGQGTSLAGVTIDLSGTQSRETITDRNGIYRFDNVAINGSYTLTPSRVNYSFSPTTRSFTLLSSLTAESFVGAASGGALNPIDTDQFLVRQHYLDFLNREPEESGFNFWTNQISSCGTDMACREVRRINASAAFFLSIEFQETGFEVHRLYKAAYGNLPNAPVPVHFDEFMPDTRQIAQGVIVNQPGWETVLENNKQAFSASFVQRSRFVSAYPNTMTPAEFVDSLFATAGVSPTTQERTAAINEFGAAATASDPLARAHALRRIAENPTLTRREFNRAFVLMEYFGYLRRDPNSGPDTDFSGYNFWLNKLDTIGNFLDAEMVKAFLSSLEYRRRFAP